MRPNLKPGSKRGAPTLFEGTWPPLSSMVSVKCGYRGTGAAEGTKPRERLTRGWSSAKISGETAELPNLKASAKCGVARLGIHSTKAPLQAMAQIKLLSAVEAARP